MNEDKRVLPGKSGLRPMSSPRMQPTLHTSTVRKREKNVMRNDKMKIVWKETNEAWNTGHKEALRGHDTSAW